MLNLLQATYKDTFWGTRYLFFWASSRDKVWSVRLWKLHVMLKSPEAFAFFSERNGYNKPFKLFGWRLFFNWSSWSSK